MSAEQQAVVDRYRERQSARDAVRSVAKYPVAKCPVAQRDNGYDTVY